MLLVKEIMTPNPLTCKIFTPVKDLINLMSKSGVGSILCVNENNTLVQIITIRDILKIISTADLNEKISTILEKINKKRENLITISPHENLLTAINLMNENQISHLPIIDENEKPIGLISLRDILKNFPSIVFIDPLTRLSNRQYLNFLIEKLNNAKDISIALMMIDIDDFKIINDTYGHIFGDKVLKEVAKCLRTNLRGYDDSIRYGGEEFLAFVYRVNKDEILNIAERIRGKVKEIKFEIPITVKVSIGLTFYKKGESILNAIKRTDEAMYKAKKAGKDRVFLL